MTCPACKRKFDRAQSREWFPFCSERCRLIDLGSWLDGSHRIPSDEAGLLLSRDDEDPIRH